MKVFGLQSIALALGLAGLAQAHMEMIYPAPFKSKANPNSNGDVDYSMTSPLDAGGANFPCKGYHSLVGSPAGKATASWKAGQTYNMTITGGANHNGGSCQASLSFDSGKSWSVIHSYVGNCPLSGTSSYDFKIPSDTPSGDALFAWTWFNKVGNREMYMNCATVSISGSSSKNTNALSNRPAMFVANVGNGCSTKEGSDLDFPSPGSDISKDSSGISPPVGKCASGGGSGSSPAPAPAPTTSKAATKPTTTAPPPYTTMYVSFSSSKSEKTDSFSTSPGGVFITVSQPATKPATAKPTSSTLLTVTKPATSAQAPTKTVTPPKPTTPSSGSDSGTQKPGSACTVEGEWNCIGGTQYQRCASAQWTVVQPMTPGTKCTGGRGMNFAWGFGKRSMRAGRRFVGADHV